MSKRYERMSKEEINNAYYSCATSKCSECMANKYCNDTIERITCVERVYDWLQKEIKTKKVHRYELIKSPADTEKLRSEFEEYCANVNCSDCRYDKGSNRVGGCFCIFLNEEIEVEE